MSANVADERARMKAVATDYEEKLIAKIDAVRQEQGLSYQELSSKAGLGDTAVRDICNGRSKKPGFTTLRAIIEALGFDMFGFMMLVEGDASGPAFDWADAGTVVVEEVKPIAVYRLDDGRIAVRSAGRPDAEIPMRREDARKVGQRLIELADATV